MTKTQIDLVKININILTAWIETLQMKLKRAIVDDEPPLINEIENYRALIRNLEGVLQIENEIPEPLRNNADAKEKISNILQGAISGGEIKYRYGASIKWGLVESDICKIVDTLILKENS